MDIINKKEALLENIRQMVWKMNRNSRFYKTRNYRQHGNTSVYIHSIAVCIKSIDIALKFNLSVDWDSLIRGGSFARLFSL